MFTVKWFRGQTKQGRHLYCQTRGEAGEEAAGKLKFARSVSQHSPVTSTTAGGAHERVLSTDLWPFFCLVISMQLIQWAYLLAEKEPNCFQGLKLLANYVCGVWGHCTSYGSKASPSSCKWVSWNRRWFTQRLQSIHRYWYRDTPL